MDYRMGFKQVEHLFYCQVNLFSRILIYITFEIKQTYCKGIQNPTTYTHHIMQFIGENLLLSKLYD